MRMFSVLGLSIVMLIASANAGENSYSIDQSAAASWLLDSNNDRDVAVGLLLRSVETDASQAQFADKESVIDLMGRSENHDTLAVIALTCLNAELLEVCRDAGLDQALVDHAQGNLLLRAWLFEDESAWTDTIRETSIVQDVTHRIAKTINDALLAYLAINSSNDLAKHAGEQAMAIAMAAPVPLNEIVEVCKSTSASLEGACMQALETMTVPQNSVITRVTGMKAQEERLIAAGNDDQALALVKDREQLWSRFSCLQYELPDNLDERLNGRQIKRFIDTAAAQGELAALETLASAFNLQCGSSDQHHS